ncbi:MAG: hypothetical protein KAG82_02275 [Alcanivoracaceae bacterium]|nr:hypothetical protein [Alcanivoracaceae bacterium]
MIRLVPLLLALASAPCLAERPDLQPLDDSNLSESRLTTALPANPSSVPDAASIEEQQRLLPSEHLPASPQLDLTPQAPLPAHDPGQFVRDLANTINPPGP